MSIKFSCLLYIPAANITKESQTHIQEMHRWLSAMKPLTLLGSFEILWSFGLECSSISHIILSEHLLEIAEAKMMVKVSVIQGGQALQGGCWHYTVYLEVAEAVDATSLLCVHVHTLTTCVHMSRCEYGGGKNNFQVLALVSHLAGAGSLLFLHCTAYSRLDSPRASSLYVKDPAYECVLINLFFMWIPT